MGFSRNNKSTLAQEESRLNAIQYEQSTYGTTKQVIYGTNNICGNLIDNVDFTAIEHKSSVKMGKGGQSQTSTSYTYKSRVVIGLCYGAIRGVRKVSFDDGIYSLNQLNLAFFNGSPNQNAWGEMVSRHPNHALNYRNLAYVAGYIDLTTSAGVPQYHFEVAGKCIANGYDANPKDIVLDVLTNSIYGAGFPSAYIDMPSLRAFSNYCIANNLFLSPVYDAQDEVQSILTDLVEICNSTFIWTQGKLKVIPLCDEKISANGATFKPDLTPVYDFDETDFIDDDEPVVCTRSDQADIYNSVKIEYKNRANDYATEVVEAQDLANIELYGLRAADTQKAHQICVTDIAQRTAQLALDRGIAVRNIYKFKVPFRFILLDAMDIVTLTYSRLGLYREPVRIRSIKEDDHQLEIEAEEMVIGTASPAKIETQEAISMSVDANQTVGNVNPIIIFEPPMELTHNTLEVWVGVSSDKNLFGGCEIYVSDDGSTYKLIGTMTNQARQGVLKQHLFTSDENPDMQNTLVVDMNMSNSELLSGTQEDAERLNTLCYVDGEFLAYKDAELTDIGIYNLNYLNRGAYSSEIKTHYKDSQFVRIDEDAFLKIPFSKEDIGKKLLIKCPTFNSFGGGLQTLGDVNPYSYKIEGRALKQAPENVTGLTNYYSDGLNIIKWQPVDDTRNIVYEIRKGSSWGKAQCMGRIAQTTFTANGNGTYWIKAFVPDYNIYSERAVSLEITGARLVQNVIEIIDEHALHYQGTKTASMYVDEYGVLSLAGKGKVSEIPVFSEISSLLFYGGVMQEGIFEVEKVVDIGAASKCYINIEYNFLGENPYSTFGKIPKLSEVERLIDDFGGYITNSRIQLAIATEEEFGQWQDFVNGQYFGRKFKFRVVLASSSDTIVAKMNKFTINVDVPDIVETGNLIQVNPEGKHIAFEKHFHAVPNLQVTILDKESGDDEFITNLNEAGFDICLKNGTTAISKNINFVAQGY